MPIFEPLAEVQKEFLPIVNDFLARADTQGLHSIVEKHIQSTAKLQGTFEMLKGAVERVQLESEGLRASNEKYTLETEKLRASNEKYGREIEKLQTSVLKLQGANEELRITNAKLETFPRDMIEKVNTIEEKLDVDLENIVNNLESKTRVANQDLNSRVGQLHNNTRAALKDLQKQMHDLDARQQHSEQSLDQVADAVHDLHLSLNMEEASQELYQDSHAQSSHGSRKRQYGYDRDEELAAPHYGERYKRHARDNFQDDAASRPTNPIKQPPRLARQDAAKVEDSSDQRLTAREAFANVNQPETIASGNFDVVNPRFEAIKAHYNAAKSTFNASKSKDQRSFIWKFIEGSGDDEFCTWFQEHLLQVLPSDKVTRSAKKSRRSGGRIIALDRSLTWEEVRHVVRDIPQSLPPFLE